MISPFHLQSLPLSHFLKELVLSTHKRRSTQNDAVTMPEEVEVSKDIHSRKPFLQATTVHPRKK